MRYFRARVRSTVFLQLLVVLAMAMLVGLFAPSAFAASKPSNPTITFASPSPAEGATVTTNSVSFSFTYNRTPKQTKTLTCALAGPTASAAAACKGPTASGSSGSQSTGNAYSGLGNGSYTFTASLVLTDNEKITATRHFTVNSVPSCIVTNTRTSATYSSLQAGNDAAQDGDTLTIQNTCIGTSTISHNLTISGVSGTSPTLDGNQQGGSVMAIDAGTNVAVSGLTIKNGSATNGGGVAVEAATVTLTNVTITNNSATGAGGGIYADTAIGAANQAAVTCTGCTISSNSAAYGGAGAAVNSDLTLTNTSVSGNTASVEGGGIYAYTGSNPPFSLTAPIAALGFSRLGPVGPSTPNDATICANGTIAVGAPCTTGLALSDSTSISGNTAPTGASVFTDNAIVHADSTVTIEGGVTDLAPCKVANLTLVWFPNGGQGYNTYPNLQLAVDDAQPGDTLQVQGTCTGTTDIIQSVNITNDAATLLDGGGHGPVITVEPGITATISGIGIENGSNTSTNVPEGYGGGIANYGNLTLSEVSVTGNTSVMGGGGIYNAGTLTLNNVTVSSNGVTSGNGGGILDFFGTVNASNLIVTGNSASSGGGVVEDGGALTLDDSSIDHNTASALGGGVFLVTPGGSVTLNTNSVITQNTAASGGGIYNNDGGTIGGDGTGIVTGNTPDNIVG